ncbi:MAG: hypothetical protein LBE62_13860 [Azonexus sp.]|jgi:hypothetical protein|nr:hypothetical protein [Azonexus sp.]
MMIGAVATSAFFPSVTAHRGPDRAGEPPSGPEEQAGQPEKSTAQGRGELTPEQQQQVAQLQQTDRQVRAHEQAHMAAGAGLAGGATYSYETGPDNRRYAVAGEVSIDTSPARSPEETIAKARQIRAAALAPADPSAQDNRVAAAASQMEIAARQELAQTERAENNGAALAAYRQVAANDEAASGFAAIA